MIYVPVRKITAEQVFEILILEFSVNFSNFTFGFTLCNSFS